MVNGITKYGGGGGGEGVTLALLTPDGSRVIINSLNDRFTDTIHIFITYLVILQENWRRKWRIIGFFFEIPLEV